MQVIVISFGINEPFLVILKIEYRLNQRWVGVWGGGGGGGRVYAASQTTVVYEETQSNQVSDFCDFVYSLFSKAILLDFYFTV